MEETAFFLGLAVNGLFSRWSSSGRCGPRPSAPTTRNLYEHGGGRGQPGREGRGVLSSVLNDEIHAARNVTKTDTTSVDTFQPTNGGAVGLVHRLARSPGSSAWTVRTRATRSSTCASAPRLRRASAIIYAHANMS